MLRTEAAVQKQQMHERIAHVAVATSVPPAKFECTALKPCRALADFQWIAYGKENDDAE